LIFAYIYNIMNMHFEKQVHWGLRP